MIQSHNSNIIELSSKREKITHYIILLKEIQCLFFHTQSRMILKHLLKRLFLINYFPQKPSVRYVRQVCLKLELFYYIQSIDTMSNDVIIV